MRIVLTITDPKTGESFTDVAYGNTPRALKAACAALTRSYRLDGMVVTR